MEITNYCTEVFWFYLQSITFSGRIDVFTALHGMQTRSSDENSVSPSARLSVRHTREL